MGLRSAETGQLIRAYRKRKGLTQGELGARLGLSTSAIMRYELGQRGITLEQLQAIADALEVDVFSLLDFDAASDVLSERMIESITYREQIKTAFDSLTLEGQKLAALAVEVIAGNPSYREATDCLPPLDGESHTADMENDGGI